MKHYYNIYYWRDGKREDTGSQGYEAICAASPEEAISLFIEFNMGYEGLDTDESNYEAEDATEWVLEHHKARYDDPRWI